MPLSQAVLDGLAAGRVEINGIRNQLITLDKVLANFEGVAPHVTQTAQIVNDLQAIRTNLQNIGTQLSTFGTP